MAEPLKATFFTLKHRDRAVLAPATLVLVVIVAVLGAIFLALNWNLLTHFGDLAPLTAAQSKDPQRAFAFIGQIFGFVGAGFLLLIPLYFALAAYETACLRWMIRGEAPGWFGWRVDDDVWRVYGLYWCWLITHFAVGMAVGVLVTPIMFATMPGFFSNGSPPDIATMMRWQFSVQVPLSFLQYLPLIFIGVRLGPAAATSVARQRFSFFEAWKVTRGRFWALLGSFALLWLIAIVLIAMIAALTVGPILSHMWPLFQAIWTKPSETNMQDYFHAFFSPQILAFACAGYAGNVIVVLGLALMSYGVNARAAIAALQEGKIAAAP